MVKYLSWGGGLFFVHGFMYFLEKEKVISNETTSTVAMELVQGSTKDLCCHLLTDKQTKLIHNHFH